MAPRLMAKASSTIEPFARPRFRVSTNTPLALRLWALHSAPRRPAATTYTVALARCRLCKRRSIPLIPVTFLGAIAVFGQYADADGGWKVRSDSRYFAVR